MGKLTRANTKTPAIQRVGETIAGKVPSKPGFLVRLPAPLAKRLRVKLAEENKKFQQLAVELIEQYVDGDSSSPTDFDRQVQAARASMRKNAVALRELAK